MVEPAGQGYIRSTDGLELHMATNYLGPFLLTMLLLPALRRTGTQVGLVHMMYTLDSQCICLLWAAGWKLSCLNNFT